MADDSASRTSQRLTVTVFGAAGPTGLLICEAALAAGHSVRAVSRSEAAFPLPPSPRLKQVKADALTGTGVRDACTKTDAVLSTLGTSYQRGKVEIYSRGTRHIGEALRESGRSRRLVVVSSGLTYDAPHLGPFTTTVVFPLLRHVLGRTLYADMRRMEDYLRAQSDLTWTVMRPGRLYDAPFPGPYRLDPERPTQAFTSRITLARAMLAELDTATSHPQMAISPTTNRKLIGGIVKSCGSGPYPVRWTPVVSCPGRSRD